MRQASGLVLTGFVLLVLFAIGTVLLDHRAADLEAHGARVDGVVIAVHQGIRNSWSADVGYTVQGVRREGLVQLDHTGATLRRSDAVTVIYDPADPERIALPGMPSDPGWAITAMSLFLVFGLGFVGGGSIRAFRAARAR
ncbi:Protein of unknown function [Lentzea xinjiangensis]|uniref:DUF3592 domain-containing protein n=1 Tax=Lentzea xinjiangensis TaxID=402600 RepID=A0A1H9W7X5_9PSEU|nr:DUF3592 domain-containing protein [Lentzea xinjiangensis]SES30022.1 Protein of unknown function [Lentzea xinjiangensis]